MFSGCKKVVKKKKRKENFNKALFKRVVENRFPKLTSSFQLHDWTACLNQTNCVNNKMKLM